MRRAWLLVVLFVVSVLALPETAVPVAAAEPVGWQAPESIESDYWGSAVVPRVGVDAAGNAIAVWIQDNGTAYHVRAGRYVPGSGWGAPVTFDTPTPGSPNVPELAVAASGVATAVWSVYDGVANTTIYAERYLPGAGWGPLEVVNVSAAYPSPLQVGMDAAADALVLWSSSEGASFALYAARYVVGSGWGATGSVPVPGYPISVPRLAVDGGGNATAVYAAYTGSTFPVYANRFAPGSGWDAPELLEDAPPSQTPYPEVAADPAGRAIAVWDAYGTGGTDIHARRFVPGTGWEALQLLETNGTTYAHGPQIAMDASGNGVAVWTEQNATGFAVRSNRFVPGSGWGAPSLVATVVGGSPPFLDVAANAQGDAVAAWWEFGSGFMSGRIRANHFVPGSGWGTAELLQAAETGTFTEPRAGIDGSGRAVVVWYASDGTLYHIVANRYVPGTGWTGPEPVETDLAEAFEPVVAVDPAGNAVAVWSQYSLGGMSVYANRYVVGSGWGEPVPLRRDPGHALSPQVGMDAAGNAIAAWLQTNTTAAGVYAARFVPGTGWGVAERLVNAPGGGLAMVSLAVGSGGDAVAMWQFNNGTKASVWADVFAPDVGWGVPEDLGTPQMVGSVWPVTAVGPEGVARAAWIEYDAAGIYVVTKGYVPGTGWGALEYVSQDPVSSPWDLQVGMGDAGDTMVLWAEQNATAHSVHANRYVPGTGWGTPTLLASGASVTTPALAVGEAGNAIAAWSLWDGAYAHLQAKLFVPATGWGTATLLETNTTGDAYFADVALDAHGNAMVLWVLSTPAQSLYAARYSTRSGWQAPELVHRAGAGFSPYWRIAVNPDGAGFAVWSEVLTGGSIPHVFASRYVSPDVVPPVADAGPDRTVAVGALIAFNGSASTDNVGVTAYRWTFDDGGMRTLTGVSPTYSFDHAGTVTVTLEVADAEENTATDTVAITVTPAPDITRPLAEAGPDQSVRAGDVVTLDASGSTDDFGIASYSWSLNDGQVRTLSGVAPTYTFNQPGTYLVTLNVTDAAGNFDTDTLVVSVASTTGAGGEAFPPLAIGIIAALAVLAGVLGVLFYVTWRRKAQVPPPPEEPKTPGA